MINLADLTESIKNIQSTLYVITEEIPAINMKPENDLGFVEYKRCLIQLSNDKIEKYATQMQWRIGQNSKKNYATYFIGIDDNGSVFALSMDQLVESIRYFIKICNKINASISSIVLIHDNINVIIKINVKIKIKSNDLMYICMLD